MAKITAGRSVSKTVVALKVTLRDIKPPVWRRLVLPGTMTLVELHEAIQAAMGWHRGKRGRTRTPLPPAPAWPWRRRSLG